MTKPDDNEENEMTDPPEKAAFKSVTRQPRPDDPMFGKLHVAAIRFPTPSPDNRAEDEEREAR